MYSVTTQNFAPNFTSKIGQLNLNDKKISRGFPFCQTFSSIDLTVFFLDSLLNQIRLLFSILI